MSLQRQHKYTFFLLKIKKQIKVLNHKKKGSAWSSHTYNTLFIFDMVCFGCQSPLSLTYILMPCGLKELRSRPPLIWSSTGCGCGCSRSRMYSFPGSSENEGIAGCFIPWVQWMTLHLNLCTELLLQINTHLLFPNVTENYVYLKM